MSQDNVLFTSPSLRQWGWVTHRMGQSHTRMSQSWAQMHASPRRQISVFGKDEDMTIAISFLGLCVSNEASPPPVPGTSNSRIHHNSLPRWDDFPLLLSHILPLCMCYIPYKRPVLLLLSLFFPPPLPRACVYLLPNKPPTRDLSHGVTLWGPSLRS